MKCDLCNGRGWIDNPRYYNVPSWQAYEDGIPTRLECKKCKGHGFILGNVEDAINLLDKAVADKRGLTETETKQLLNIIIDYNNDTK